MSLQTVVLCFWVQDIDDSISDSRQLTALCHCGRSLRVYNLEEDLRWPIVVVVLVNV